MTALLNSIKNPSQEAKAFVRYYSNKKDHPMPTAAELKRTSPPSILIYGPPGTGKTSLLGTLGEKVQILDLDGGVRRTLSLRDDWREERLKCDVVELEEKNPARPDAAKNAKLQLDHISKLCKAGQYPFQAVAVDGLTFLAESYLKAACVNEKLDFSHQTPHMRIWQLAIQQVQNFCMRLKSLPIVRILTAHTQLVTIDENEVERIGIYGRNLPISIPGLFDEIWYTKVRNAGGGKVEFTLRTKPSGSITARSIVENNANQNEGLLNLISQLGHKL